MISAHRRKIKIEPRHWADPRQQRPGEINRNDGGRGLYVDDPAGHHLEVITPQVWQRSRPHLTCTGSCSAATTRPAGRALARP